MTEITKPELAQVIEWAKFAGAIARQRFHSDHDLGYKGATDLVTEVDHQCEEYLVGEIRRWFPSHSILTEESGSLNGGSGDCWYIDPLDGTINYAHRIPIYVISIAWQHAGKIQLGVVYDPSSDECYFAERRKGAYLNGKPIHPSSVTELEKSLHATAFTRRDSNLYERNLHVFNYLNRSTQGVRRMGCAALETCYVACGKLDAYWFQNMNAWDIAAAMLIVEEAGGKVTSLTGSSDYFKPPYSVLACAPGIQEQMLELFRDLK